MSYHRVDLSGWGDSLKKIGSGFGTVLGAGLDVFGQPIRDQARADALEEAAAAGGGQQASVGGGMSQYLPWLLVGGGVLAIVVVMTKKKSAS